MTLTVNGIDVQGSYSGASPNPMNSDFPGDVALIGHWTSNGTPYFFSGKMDEVTIWNRDLSIDEIRNYMSRKLTGSE